MQLNDAVAPLLCYGYRRYFAAPSDPLRMATIRTTVRALRFFSPSDLNDHIFEASGEFIQHFAPVFADHDSVRVSNASPVGIVDSRLAAESHAPLEDGLVAFGDPRGFVAFETNAVTSAVFEELLESGFADLVETLVVDFFGDRSFFQILDSGVVGGEHGIVEVLGVVGWLADACGHLQLFVSNRDCCFDFFVTGEREVINSVQTFRLTFLENEVQASQEGANGPLAGQAVRHPLNLLVRKAPSDELFGVRIRNNVDRLRFVLQGSNDIVQKLLAVRKERSDHVLARRTYRHAIGGLVVRAERQALPHGDRLST